MLAIPPGTTPATNEAAFKTLAGRNAGRAAALIVTEGPDPMLGKEPTLAIGRLCPRELDNSIRIGNARRMIHRAAACCSCLYYDARIRQLVFVGHFDPNGTGIG